MAKCKWIGNSIKASLKVFAMFAKRMPEEVKMSKSCFVVWVQVAGINCRYNFSFQRLQKFKRTANNLYFCKM